MTKKHQLLGRTNVTTEIIVIKLTKLGTELVIDLNLGGCDLTVLHSQYYITLGILHNLFFPFDSHVRV